MAKDTFETAIEEVFAHEGGYVNHKKDPGGETNYGISKRSYPHVDIRRLTREKAAHIYRRDFWEKVKGDELPDGLDLVALDGAVNSGVSRGVKWLQIGVKTKADGVMGPATVKASHAVDLVDAIQKSCAARMGFLRSLKTFGTFGRGWSRRVASVEAKAVRMALEARGTTQASLSRQLAGEAYGASLAVKRNQTAAGGSVAAGAGVTTFNDLPMSAVVLLALGVAVVVMLAVMRARIQTDRREAYEEQLKQVVMK